MMNFLARRRYKKLVKHVLHEARHAVNMREDLMSDEDHDRMQDAREKVSQAWASQEPDAIEEGIDQLVEVIDGVYPERSWPKVRENVEVIVVALAVAMAFRTFIIQPFKIPTGSMQPTLYGITEQAREAPTLWDRFPLNIGKMLIGGRKFTAIRAQSAGRIQPYGEERPHSIVIYIDGIPYEISKTMTRHFKLGDVVDKGQILATGDMLFGDHIFVDKIRYNFSRPKRGDIIVFDTANIDHPQIKPDNFYIKRCVALPGETVEISPPFLLVNGEPVTSPYAFERQVQERDKGYYGYQFARRHPSVPAKLAGPGETLTLADDEYLPFGDNTRESLDGRYFGGVREEAIVGPAFCVYWPFTSRWGLVQ
jgi:signal peptidase I